jgi:hypothetical protein
MKVHAQNFQEGGEQRPGYFSSIAAKSNQRCRHCTNHLRALSESSQNFRSSCSFSLSSFSRRTLESTVPPRHEDHYTQRSSVWNPSQNGCAVAFQDLVQLSRFVTRFLLSGTLRSPGRTEFVTRHHTRASRHGSVPSQSWSRRTNHPPRRISHIEISRLTMRHFRSRYNHTRSASRGRLTRHAHRHYEAINILEVSSSHTFRRSCLLPHPQPRGLQHAFQLQHLVLTRYRRTATRAALPRLLPISQHCRLCKHRRCVPASSCSGLGSIR